MKDAIDVSAVEKRRVGSRASEGDLPRYIEVPRRRLVLRASDRERIGAGRDRDGDGNVVLDAVSVGLLDGRAERADVGRGETDAVSRVRVDFVRGAVSRDRRAARGAEQQGDRGAGGRMNGRW